METFLVGNHCHIFRKIIKSNAVNISKSTNEYYQKIIEKKWPQNGPLSCYGETETLSFQLQFSKHEVAHICLQGDIHY